MSKALRHMNKTEAGRAIQRRLAERTLGMGYWAAVDALERAARLKAKALAEARKLANA